MNWILNHACDERKPASYVQVYHSPTRFLPGPELWGFWTLYLSLFESFPSKIPTAQHLHTFFVASDFALKRLRENSLLVIKHTRKHYDPRKSRIYSFMQFQMKTFDGCKKCVKAWEVSFPHFLYVWETPETLTFISWVISWIWLCIANTEQPGWWARRGAGLNRRLTISCPAMVCKCSEKALPSLSKLWGPPKVFAEHSINLWATQHKTTSPPWPNLA